MIVREAFELHEQHGSALVVAQLLNERGLTTKRHTANGRTPNARPWSKDAVLRVLKNAIYAGYIPCGDELHDGEHEALIARDRFRRVQALLDSRRGRALSRGRNPEYLLRGLLY